MFRIYESADLSIRIESHCETVEAASNRVKMLKRRNPDTAYWFDRVTRVVIQSPEKVSLLAA